MMQALINSVSSSLPAALSEVITLGRTLMKARGRRAGILRPTEAINGRLEHLQSSAPGFRNLANYIARLLLEAGGFRPHLHPQIV